MNKSTLTFILLFTCIIAWTIPVKVLAQKEQTADTTMKSMENYREQIRRLVGFLEFSLNTLGSPETSTKEKETIINESYLKAFMNEKVQVEDDLDENREILTYKDVQAYLKDVDFFFKEATFNITVQDIQSLKNDQGMPYFKVTANRNLQAVTVTDEIINSNKIRYIEINVDEEEQVLKIASIYTTRLNEAQELMTWWNGMPAAWKNVLAGDNMVTDSIRLSQVDFLNDTTLLFVHEVPVIKEVDGFYYIGNDSLLITKMDTAVAEIYDTIRAGKNNGVRMLKSMTKFETLDVSGNLSLTDLYPADQLSDLKSLNISNTLITDLFPARTLTHIESLNITGTDISDLSPIQYNTRIRELYLDSTQVSSLMPIKDFIPLEVLQCSNTHIDSLDYIRNLSNIRDLRCKNTPVQNLAPIGDLINLQNLSIAGTKVDNLEAIQYLITLKRINLENTPVTDLAPLGKLDSLEIIDADQTAISSLEPLGNLPALQKIYCDQTRITRPVANAFMAAHPHVLVIYESLELSGWWSGLNLDWQTIFKGYVQLDPQPSTEQLHQLTLVSQVNIEGNSNITSLEPLAKLSNLKELKAGKTLVSDLTPLSELVDLQFISCPGTRISSLRPLKTLENLETLDLSNTLVDSLDGLSGLDHLQVLYIDGTGVDDLKPLNDCREISTIYCDNTKIGKVDIDGFLDSQPQCLIIYQSSLLKNWWLGLPASWKSAFRTHTQLDETPTREQLHTLAALDSLDFSGNRDLATLSPLTTLHRLQNLNLANCGLQDITPLRDLVRLKRLNLSGNPLVDLAPISYLPQLISLDISNTPVEKLDAIKPLVSLEYLNCSGTQIKKLDPLAGMIKLKKLECYNTSVSNLKPLTGLIKLKQLVCYNTNLSSKKVDAFKAESPGLEVVFY